ncbi:MAG TPA: hypothetical protein P5223_08905, partial [Phycisphaerae bacterium]|nr:hypothetical protein [Phycisphaerae bacterium]
HRRRSTGAMPKRIADGGCHAQAVSAGMPSLCPLYDRTDGPSPPKPASSPGAARSIPLLQPHIHRYYPRITGGLAAN